MVQLTFEHSVDLQGVGVQVMKRLQPALFYPDGCHCLPPPFAFSHPFWANYCYLGRSALHRCGSSSPEAHSHVTQRTIRRQLQSLTRNWLSRFQRERDSTQQFLLRPIQLVETCPVERRPKTTGNLFQLASLRALCKTSHERRRRRTSTKRAYSTSIRDL